jgi:DNA-binding MarR family transcriptional regulator
MVAKSDVETVLECYVRIHVACHSRPNAKAGKRPPVSPTQANVLEFLDVTSGITVLDLARLLGIAPSTMSLTLDRLERATFVRRRKDPGDGRRTLIYLTPAGLTVKRQQQILEPALIAAMLNRLPAPRRKEVIASLLTLSQAASDLVGQAPLPPAGKRNILTHS